MSLAADLPHTGVNLNVKGVDFRAGVNEHEIAHLNVTGALDHRTEAAVTGRPIRIEATHLGRTKRWYGYVDSIRSQEATHQGATPGHIYVCVGATRYLRSDEHLLSSYPRRTIPGAIREIADRHRLAAIVDTDNTVWDELAPSAGQTAWQFMVEAADRIGHWLVPYESRLYLVNPLRCHNELVGRSVLLTEDDINSLEPVVSDNGSPITGSLPTSRFRVVLDGAYYTCDVPVGVYGDRNRRVQENVYTTLPVEANNPAEARALVNGAARKNALTHTARMMVKWNPTIHPGMLVVLAMRGEREKYNGSWVVDTVRHRMYHKKLGETIITVRRDSFGLPPRNVAKKPLVRRSGRGIVKQVPPTVFLKDRWVAQWSVR